MIVTVKNSPDIEQDRQSICGISLAVQFADTRNFGSDIFDGALASVVFCHLSCVFQQLFDGFKFLIGQRIGAKRFNVEEFTTA